MALPNMTPEDYVARMDEFQYEVYRLSKAVRDDSASIHGAAISNTSLLLIKYVEPERLRLLWQPPPYPPDIEQAFPDFSEYINDYLEDFDDLPTEGIPPPWIAHRRSCDVYHALAGIIHETLLHNPESDLDRPIPYTAFDGVPLDASYMYWCCRSVYFTPNTPNMTVISIHPQQGPPNQLTLTELWTLLYFGLRFSRRVKNMSYMAVRLISICDTQARIVSAKMSREYLYFAYRAEISRLNPRVSCEVSVEDYQDLSDKKGYLYLMPRIAEVGVKAGPEAPK